MRLCYLRNKYTGCVWVYKTLQVSVLCCCLTSRSSFFFFFFNLPSRRKREKKEKEKRQRQRAASMSHVSAARVGPFLSETLLHSLLFFSHSSLQCLPLFFFLPPPFPAQTAAPHVQQWSSLSRNVRRCPPPLPATLLSFFHYKNSLPDSCSFFSVSTCALRRRVISVSQ